jgi:hypothetical protein
MKKLLMAACMAVVAHAQQDRREDLILRLHAGSVPGPLLALAKSEASAILRQVGTRVFWQTIEAHPEPAPLRECGIHQVDIHVIDILIRDRSSAQEHPGALGYSLPFASSGFRVVVFYDRVIGATDRPSAKLLGNVIAHEVGHMLMGTGSHSGKGLMRAHWSRGEMATLQQHALSFTDGDALLISLHFRQQRACVLLAGR